MRLQHGKKILIVGSLLISQLVFANPEGGTVTAGSASITGGSGYLEVNQKSNQAAIDWQRFNIGQGETTRFIQPSADSSILNRVVGKDPSYIFGNLQSNGKVFLTNQAGVVFGSTARVDVGGLVATTANISNQDFMSGKYNFVQQPGLNTAVLVQKGAIISAKDSGIVALVAPGVENNGLIQARLGKVALASGTKFTVDLYGDQLINFATDAQAPSARATTADGRILTDAVSNNGSIIADGGKVLLTAQAARGVVNNAINMSGYIQANAVASGRGGDIILLGGREGQVSVNGKVSASGRGSNGRGGLIKVTGEKIVLTNAYLDASGDVGGGQIYVGGGAHGKDSSIMNAETTSIDKSSVLNADAIVNGDGGNIIVWSDQQTNFAGSVLARGGQYGGNGGFMEVSGSRLAFDHVAHVDASAAYGKRGKLLLDPINVNIINGGGSIGSSTVDPTNIVAILHTGTDVSITADNNITVSDEINAVAHALGNLTLSAGNSVFINANIKLESQFSGGANLTVNANQSGAAFSAANRSAGGSVISIGTNVLLGSLNHLGDSTITFNFGNANQGSGPASNTFTMKGFILNGVSSVTLNGSSTQPTTFIGTDGSINTWTISGADSGKFDSFSNNSVNPTINFNHVSSLVGGTGGTDTIVGPNLDTTWNITGNNSGDFAVSGQTMTFSNIVNLVAGSGDDVFRFATSGQLSGLIFGGNGTNTIDLTAFGPNPGFRVESSSTDPSFKYLLNAQGQKVIILDGFGNISNVLFAQPVSAQKTTRADLANETQPNLNSNTSPSNDPTRSQYQVLVDFVFMAINPQIIVKSPKIDDANGLEGRTPSHC